MTDSDSTELELPIEIVTLVVLILLDTVFSSPLNSIINPMIDSSGGIEKALWTVLLWLLTTPLNIALWAIGMITRIKSDSE